MFVSLFRNKISCRTLILFYSIVVSVERWKEYLAWLFRCTQMEVLISETMFVSVVLILSLFVVALIKVRKYKFDCLR